MIGALKNLVGICARKKCLPHHTKLSDSCVGDEYMNPSKLRRVISNITDEVNKNISNKKYFYVNILNPIRAVLNKLDKESIFGSGSWYGNDTINRTVSDMNKIIRYVDKKGDM